jgi:hypothetical protein
LFAGTTSHDGNYNTSVGLYAGFSDYDGSHNTCVGSQAGESNGNGNNNTFIGSTAGMNNDSGSYNTFIGSDAGAANVSSINNTYVGQAAGFTATGSNNVFIGNGAGYYEKYGNNKLYIDNFINSGSAPLISGDFSAQYVKINGQLITASDKRAKKNIETLTSSLDKVMNLRGVSYERLGAAKDSSFGGRKEIGLIAQEVERIIPELVHTDGKGFKAIAYDKIVPVLIEAIKEQQKTIAEQQAVNKEFADQLASMKAELNRLKSKDITAQK